MCKNIRVGLVSLGCPKNQCDAELMLAKIAKAGYKLVEEPGLSDVVIINTCGFIQSAKEEAIEEILEAISRQKDGINKKIIITGCLAERYIADMKDEFPEVSAIIGLSKNVDIVEVIERVLGNERVIEKGDKTLCLEGERVLTTLPHYAYLRIADGCDNCCTYCAIPNIRGHFISRPMENIVAEASKLAESGVSELVVVAQDTTRYGLDLYGELKLPQLICELCGIDGIKWIRLLYCYPERITDELIDVIKHQKKVVKYLDIPIQHCNGRILKLMNREGNEKTLWNLFAKLREEIPDLVIRTTVMAGFPSETQAEFDELAQFVDDITFERLGCFPYSAEEGTVAATLPNQVDPEECIHRAEVIMEQQEIRMESYSRSFIGTSTEVVCEGYDRYSEMYFGRNYMFAPEIDGLIYFKSSKKQNISDNVKVLIEDVVDNNLIGTAEEDLGCEDIPDAE